MGTKPSKAEWERIDECMKRLYEPVALMCDGYHVILRVEPFKGLSLKISVYVNGKMSFSTENHPEETIRFSFPSRRYHYSAKNRALIKKEPKWLIKKMGLDPDATYTIYLPWWGSFKTLKAHLVKHNESIELLKDWKYQEVVE
jgi:hypothetical protein